MVRRAVTIGVYGFSAEAFFEALRKAGVDVLLDVRQRRGVRGAKYAWANSKRLQDGLEKHGIGYRHLPELAPTTEMRERQYEADAEAGVGQRTRTEIGEAFRTAYLEEVLAKVDLESVFEDLSASSIPALFCVEAEPRACHRSLIADRLAERYGVEVEHLRPGEGG